MIITKTEINKVDLRPYIEYINRADHKEIFIAPPGENHYYLLSYLSFLFNNSIIVELGTHHGTSSLALSINKTNKIITYDVNNLYGVSPQPNNVDRRIGNIFSLNEELTLLNAAMIFLDTSHTGEFEQQIYDYLLVNNYKGILLLDDIHWNNEMRIFWSNITTTKYDITDIGHGVCPQGIAGTGLVDFSGQVIIN